MKQFIKKLYLMKRWIAIPLTWSLAVSFLYSEERIIAVAKSKEIAPYNEALEGFKKELKNRGIDFKLTDYGSADSQKAHLILTIGSKATSIAVKEVKDIPILFTMVVDPAKNGFAGQNVSGVSMDVSPAKNLKTLKRINPKIKKVGILYNPKETQGLIIEIGRAAQELGFELVTQKIAEMEDVYLAVRSLGPRIEALLMIPDSTVYTLDSTKDVLLHTLREKIPVIGISPSYTKAGALFSLSCDYESLGRQTGKMAVNIFQKNTLLSGSIESPKDTALSVNLITAERVGITIPPEITKEAKDVYR